jgi:transposase-like protein
VSGRPGQRPADACREHGIGSVTFYKAKYGDVEVSDARRLKAPKNENSKLKKLLAEANARQRHAEGCRDKKLAAVKMGNRMCGNVAGEN